VPPYTHVELIATAGQGTLWTATDDASGEVVALKKLNVLGEPKTDSLAISRFEREVRKQSALNHPGVMPVIAYDFGVVPPWYTMPLADYSLEKRLETMSPLPIPELSDIVLAVLDAVEFAHRQGIVHRDLKPANLLLLDRHGTRRWVVADFGLCRDTRSDSAIITQTSAAIGTVRYMAPEQFDDAHNVGPTADIYAIGCLLFYCLTGAPPGIRELELDRVPITFRALVQKATAVNRGRRHLSIADLRADFIASIDRIRDRHQDGWSTRSVRDLQDRVTHWLRPWFESSRDLHELSDRQLRDIVSSVLLSLGYTLVAGTGESSLTLAVSHKVAGTGLVLIGRHRYFAPSTTLRRLVEEVTQAAVDFGLLVTTGTLAREARVVAERDPCIEVIEGSRLLDEVGHLLDDAGGRARLGQDASG
jgi:serine/threonine protein kinase